MLRVRRGRVVASNAEHIADSDKALGWCSAMAGGGAAAATSAAAAAVSAPARC